MAEPLAGVHHITAITSDAQRAVDFYTGVLGLRLVKLTVNFDDPGSYHLYFGDGLGTPGSILTFFAWPGAPRGRQGTGQLGATAFAIPQAALAFWRDRLARHEITVAEPTERFGETVLAFVDPDGLPLELVAHAALPARPGWAEAPVPAEQAIAGFAAPTLWLRARERTERLLTETMGFRAVGSEGEVTRLITGDGAPSATVHLRTLPEQPTGTVAAGTVHHIAWRAQTDDAQLAWRALLVAAGQRVTEVLDRQYFHSIYYREPGGVLFEIATDPPGFTLDEPAERLGSTLRLPPWLEPHRALIAEALPPLRLPSAGSAAPE